MFHFYGSSYFIVKTMLEAATQRKRQKAEKKLYRTTLGPKGRKETEGAKTPNNLYYNP